MQLFADVCEVSVILPGDVDEGGGMAVVLGSAMLGRLAGEVVRDGGITREAQAERLWGIMVEMTPPGRIVKPQAGTKERRLLDAKYKIFLEMIDIQQRWRKEMEEAAV